jgi:hypothetical protein
MARRGGGGAGRSLPELHADLVAALADLQRDDLARHFGIQKTRV